ncbi:hypothetical protein JYQ62_19695 [Nostoc sp. UHCC 0702]|nr:hypothetical protein JYQ62_19695 [Nostoc sp. UHCC 0702]
MSEHNITNCPKCNGKGLPQDKQCDFCGGKGILYEASEELVCLWMAEDLGILTPEEYDRFQELQS